MCRLCICYGTQHMWLVRISNALNTALALLKLDSSFIDNGGDSLSLIRLRDACQKYGLQISFDAIIAANTLLELSECMALRVNQTYRRILQSESVSTKRKSQHTLGGSPKRLRTSLSGLAAANEAWTRRRYPMTEMQLSLVHSTLKDPRRNVISYFETHQPEDIPALQQAWKEVLKLELIFRMAFSVDESNGYMHEREDLPFLWEETILHDEKLYQQAVTRAAPPDSLIGWRFEVVTLASPQEKRKSTVIWRVHHAFIDGVSAVLIRRKVDRVLSQGRIEAGPSFTTFVTQLQAFQQRESDAATKFWKQQSERYPSPSTRILLPNPPVDSRPKEHMLDQVHVNCSIENLARFCKQAGVTPASVYHAAWGIVLSIYADSTQVCFGAVLSGRSLPINGVQSVIGPTINTLPFNISVDINLTPQQYVRQVFRDMLDLMSVQWSTPTHGFTRKFSSALNVLPIPDTEDYVDCLVGQAHTTVLSDIPMHVEIGNNGQIRLCYDPAIFFRSHIERLSVIFSAVLEAIPDDRTTMESLRNILVTRQERTQLAWMGNWASQSTTQGSVKDDLVSLFTKTAEMHPTEVAVQHHSASLTYSELHKQSSIVAQELSKYISPGDVVCVHADRTTHWIVAIYSVLKAGGVYCPFPEDLPHAVRTQNFLTSRAKLFLTGSVATKSWKPIPAEYCLSVEELLQHKEQPAETRKRDPTPESNAYLCFTSGSTGKPKGVMCLHRGLVAFQNDFHVRMCARDGWKIAQFMSPGFDGSIHEIFSALSYGATLILRDASRPFSHLKLADAAILTPSVAKALDINDFPNLKAVYLVGEAVPQSVNDSWAKSKLVFNMYGPTEATCGATIKKLVPDVPISLGFPNPSTRIYILDSQQRPVPWGVIGEIYLAGVQVAAGYMGLPDETSHRFLSDTINPHYTGEVMYKTGDRAYWNECGELAFLGRGDRQIKLRGFRIDLDDLEIRIARCYEACTAVAVAIHGDDIFALVQPADLNLSELKLQLSRHIPSYAVPRHIQAVATFPTTSVGKLDYKAIYAIAQTDSIKDKQLTASEHMAISAIKDALGTSDKMCVNIDSNLSDLGDSIFQLFLSHRLSRTLKQHIPIRLLLESTTVRQLAQTLAASKIPRELPIGDILGDYRISPIEREWWYKYNQSKDTSSFNVTYACKISPLVKRGELISAWNTILHRHRILSCKYSSSSILGLVRQYSRHPPNVTEISELDIESRANAPFNLAQDDLIRVFLSPTHMLVVISHIICDLTTLKKLLHEVAGVYNGKDLNPIAKTYFQTTWSMPAIQRHLSFWSDWLTNPPSHTFPIGKRKRRAGWTGLSHIFQVPQRTYENMLQFGSQNRISMHQLALAAVALVQQHENENCDVILGAPYLNRHSENDRSVIGLFLEPLPIRIRYPYPEEIQRSESLQFFLKPTAKRDTFVKCVKRCSRAALAHAVPWDQLLSNLNVKSDFPNHPIFDTMVSFHEADNDDQFPIEGVDPIATWTEGAKFKLMVEFSARKDGSLVMRLEYSDECYSRDDAALIARLVTEALEALVQGHEFGVIVQRLRSYRVAYQSSIFSHGNN